MKKKLYLIFTLIILIVSSPLYSQSKKSFKTKQIGREGLSEKKDNGKLGGGDPGGDPGGPGGDPEDPPNVPIGNGFLFLVGLSAAYFIVDNRRSKKQ
ncbi:MAG TPA: hypothetical protein PKW37_07225 [Salinivirgaceae bacterium]|nr:hypothetical protein [Salinivirgaceae bacterium]